MNSTTKDIISALEEDIAYNVSTLLLVCDEYQENKQNTTQGLRRMAEDGTVKINGFGSRRLGTIAGISSSPSDLETEGNYYVSLCSVQF